MDERPPEQPIPRPTPFPPSPSWNEPPGPPMPPPPRPDTLNTSGEGKDAAVPDAVKRWSWAGFLIPTIWGGVNRVWIGLLAGLPLVLNQLVHWLPSGYLSTFQIPISIYVGLKGNEIAWRKRRWKSVEHFRKIQRRWAIGCLIGLAGIVLVAAVAGFISAVNERSAGRFSGHGVSFRYPSAWTYDAGAKEITFPKPERGQSAPLWREAIVLDKTDLIVVQAFARPVIVADVATFRTLIEKAVGAGLSSLTGTGPVVPAFLGQLFGLQRTTSGKTVTSHQEVHIRELSAYQYTTEFSIRCQYAPNGEQAVTAACDQVARSFRAAVPQLEVPLQGWAERPLGGGVTIDLPPGWRTRGTPIRVASPPTLLGRGEATAESWSIANGPSLDRVARVFRPSHPGGGGHTFVQRTTIATQPALRIVRTTRGRRGTYVEIYFISDGRRVARLQFASTFRGSRLFQETFDWIPKTIRFGR